MIQTKKKPGAEVDPGSLWVSPERDIAHSGPLYVRKALQMTQEKLPGDPSVVELAKALATFVNGCVGKNSKPTVKEAFDAVKISDVEPAVFALFSTYLTRVFLCAYWAGARQAYHGTQKPLHAEDLVSFVDELSV